jgi:aryl-alcohol dehydrogenase-like predicted oxidoreductase
VSHNSTQLGLGLIGIGKPWGHAPRPVPSESDARALLEFAFELGIRYFDTAPSYGDGISEERLGRYLLAMPAAQRKLVTVATKMGEHWDQARNEPYADHAFDALRRSLDRSLERLGPFEVLQLHKTTPAALASEEVERAWEYARSLGVARIGPSASDLESARLALADSRLSVMQVPYNAARAAFAPLIDAAVERGVWVVVNRPFAMGSLAANPRQAFEFVLARRPAVVLTGTVSHDHLRDNWEAFGAATTGLPRQLF